MNNYVIYTDAAADIDREVLAGGRIKIVPMYYTVGEEERECAGQETEEVKKAFYEGQRKGDLTHTSQVTPQQYIDCFAPELEAGRDVVYLSLSSGLTRTFDNVNLAKEDLEDRYPGVHVYPVDTLSATGGMGLLAELALVNQEKGLSAEENAAALREAAKKVCHIFLVEDLMYLKRGGRIPAATAVVGTMLNIRPILVIDREGKLITVAKKRGEMPARKELVSRMKESRDAALGHRFYLIHSDAPEKPEAIEKMVREADPEADIAVLGLSPVIGAHTGPGMTAVIYFGDREKIEKA